MFYRFIRAVVYPFVHILFKIEVQGIENIPKDGGFVLCANHVSMADVFILAVTFHRTIHYMAKAELFRLKIGKWFFEKMGSFAVKRGSGDMKAIDTACEYLKQGEVFGIFPEGTRNYGERPAKAKAGAALVAAKTGADILPVSLKYSTKKAKPFCKVFVNIGPVIYLDNNQQENQRTMIRSITETLTNSIITLWEAH